MRFVLIHVIVYKNTALSLLSHSGWPGPSAPAGRSTGPAKPLLGCAPSGA